jgi:DNA modification methylase
MLIQGCAQEVLKTLEAESVRCCVTSPPYWGLRDYGADGQIGLEPTPDEYVARLVGVFRELRRVLTKDGTLWLNLGDSYAGGGCGGGGKFMDMRKEGAWSLRAHLRGFKKAPSGLKPKDLVGIPWMVAFALRADGWYLRSDIIWAKRNPMPESVKDRPTKAHEYVFLLSKSESYFYDADAIAEAAVSPPRELAEKGSFAGKTGERAFRAALPLRNKRSVWRIASHPFKGAHFATMPPELVRPCILAGSAPGDLVLDPFNGAGTTGLVALELGRRYVGIEINPAYVELSKRRLEEVQPTLFKRGDAG